MTVTEFSNEFDILYNGIATNSAPPIDTYEKSVYLTRAQLEIVNNHFNPKGNKYGRGFEGSSKRRYDLKELIRNSITTTQVSSTNNITPESLFFRIPSDTYLIIQEKALVSSTDACIDGTYINVVPKTHDEFNIQYDNPFKEPSKTVIWRMDYAIQTGTNQNVELISPYTITTYKFRYVIYPKPIVLGDLLTLYPTESLSVDGITQPQTCLLGEGVHREVLNRAVEMATADYKPIDLAVKAQMNNRNE